MKALSLLSHILTRFLIAALAFGPAGCAAFTPPPRAVASVAAEPDEIPEKTFTADEMAAKLVNAHNLEREKKELPPLELNERLTLAARRHATDMAEHQKMSHTGSNGTSPFRRMAKAGYKYSRAGENVAYGQRTVEEVMTTWMDSPPHRENILGKFTEIGVGHATDADGIPYWCVTFGTPLR